MSGCHRAESSGQLQARPASPDFGVRASPEVRAYEQALQVAVKTSNTDAAAVARAFDSLEAATSELRATLPDEPARQAVLQAAQQHVLSTPELRAAYVAAAASARPAARPASN